METAEPYDKIGSIRKMNMGHPIIFGKNDMYIWEKLVNLDDEHYTWAYSLLNYTDEMEVFRGVLDYSYKHRSDVNVYPITTDGNKGSIVQWNIKMKTMRTLEEVIYGNEFTFSGLFVDLAEYLKNEKADSSETNNNIRKEKDHLVITLGSVVLENLEHTCKALKIELDSFKPTYTPSPASRENNWPCFLSAVMGGASVEWAVRPVQFSSVKKSFFSKLLHSEPAKSYIQFTGSVPLESDEATIEEVKKQFSSIIAKLKYLRFDPIKEEL